MSINPTVTPDPIPKLAEPKLKRSSRSWPDFPWWVWMFFLFIAVGGGLLAVLRAQRLLGWTWDLGFFVQHIYAIRNGTWRNSIYGFGTFSDHVSPLLVPIAYAVGRTAVAEKLVAIQAAVVGLSVFPLYRLGCRFGDKTIGFITVFWFACSAAVWHAMMFDFHVATFALPVAAWLLLENERGSGGRQWFPLAAVALIREDVAVVYGLVALIAGFRQRRRPVVVAGVLTIFVGFLYFVLMGMQQGIGNHFWYLFRGDSDLATLASRPFRPDVLVATAAVLVPLLIVPALRGWKRSWPGLVVVVAFAFVGPEPVALYAKDYAQAVPFLIAGAVSIFALVTWRQRIRLSVVAASLVFVLLGPIVFLGFGLPDRFASEILSHRDREVAAAIFQMIPSNASVSATEMLVPALAYRRDIHPFPGPMVCGISILYHTPSTRAVDYVAFEKSAGPVGQDWPTVLDGWGYRMIAENELIEIWKLVDSHVQTHDCPSFEEQKTAAGISASRVQRSRLD